MLPCTSMRRVLVVLAAASLTLLPAMASGAHHDARAFAARINVEFQDVDIHEVMRTFAELGRVNIIVQSGVSGRVTATLRSTTWQSALEQILRSQGLKAERDGNVIYVRPYC